MSRPPLVMPIFVMPISTEPALKKPVTGKGQWSDKKKRLEAIEPDNENFIKELKEDTSSNPRTKPSC